MVSSDKFVQPAIPRFDGHFDHWSLLMENFLRSKEMWSLMEDGIPVIGEGTAAVTEAQRKAMDEAKLKDLKVKNYLFQSIDREILETILDKSTSKGIWNSMKQKYEGSTKVKRALLQALRRESELLSMKEGQEEEEAMLKIANGSYYRGRHFQSECPEWEKDANYAELDDAEEMVLMAYADKQKTSRKQIWFLDSGCSNHMTGDKEWFCNMDEDYRNSVKLGNDVRMAVMGKGNVVFEVQVLVEKEVRLEIKCLRTDRGGEYNSTEFKEFCENNGIRKQLTVPYTPHQNGVAKRKNRTLLNMVRGVLKARAVPKIYWAEATAWCVHVLNRSPTAALEEITPEEIWSNRKPSVGYFRIFGCVAHVHVPKEKRRKLDDKSIKCVLFGVRGNHCSRRGRKQIQQPNNSNESIAAGRNEEAPAIENQSKRVTKAPGWMGEYVSGKGLLDGEEVVEENLAMFTPTCDPLTYDDAVKEECWKQAMKQEIEAIEKMTRGSYVTCLMATLRNKVSIIQKYLHRLRDGTQSEPSLQCCIKGNKVTGTTLKLIEEFKVLMKAEFEMTNMGEMQYFLGVEVIQDEHGIYLSQRKYAREILERFNLWKLANSVKNPIVPRCNLVKDDGSSFVDATLYKQMVGCMMYLSATRPDLMFVISLLSRYMANPTKQHMAAMQRVLRYIKGTLELGIFYKRGGSKLLVACSDSDYAGDLDSRRSTSGSIELSYCNTLVQAADIMTKPLKLEQYEKLRDMLGICKCVFNPPNGVIRWDNLKCLCIEYGKVVDDSIGTILSENPCLETLELRQYYGVGQIDATLKRFKNLVLTDYGYLYYTGEDYLNTIKINAPYMLSLTINGELCLVKLLLLNVSSLVKADLCYHVRLHFANKLRQTLDDIEEVLLSGLLSSLGHVNEIILGSTCSEEEHTCIVDSFKSTGSGGAKLLVPNSKSGVTSAKESLAPEMLCHQNSVALV
ncbi:retrovirus-related pol polyprotein from transposon TNT 1-94 [Tanacetum coccineum]